MNVDMNYYRENTRFNHISVIIYVQPVAAATVYYNCHLLYILNICFYLTLGSDLHLEVYMIGEMPDTAYTLIVFQMKYKQI